MNAGMTDDELVRALKALADPTRFRMVRELANAGELSCSELGERFTLAQPTISHHMKVLVDAGILVVRAEGKHHFGSVDLRLVGDLGLALPARLGPDSPKRRRARARKSAQKSVS